MQHKRGVFQTNDATPALTSIVAHDEVDVRSKVEGSEVGVTHKVLQGDALHNPRIALKVGRNLTTVNMELVSKKNPIVIQTATRLSPLCSSDDARRHFRPPPTHRPRRYGRVWWADRYRMCSLF